MGERDEKSIRDSVFKCRVHALSKVSLLTIFNVQCTVICLHLYMCVWDGGTIQVLPASAHMCVCECVSEGACSVCRV